MIDDGDQHVKDDQGRLRFIAGRWVSHNRGKHYAARRRVIKKKDRKRHGTS